MKAKTTKTNKSEQSINAMPIITFILITVIMSLYSNFSESSTSNSMRIEKSSVGYINGISPSGNQFVILVNSEENDNASEEQNMRFMISMKGFCLVSADNQNLEIDKLIVRNKNILYSKRNSQSAELKLLANKLNEYLAPEIEPELELEIFSVTEEQPTENIYVKNEYLENLREAKIAELEKYYAIQLKFKEYLVEETDPPLEYGNAIAEKVSENLVLIKEPELELEVSANTEKQLTRNNYVKNEYLENLREIKIAELEKFYAMQLKCREYLVEETDPPLELEKWMCDDDCWCFENNITFAMNEK